MMEGNDAPKFNQNKKIKRIIVYIAVVLALAGIFIAGFAVYGNIQMRKVPGLTAKEALDYTLKGSRDGFITVGFIKNGELSYTVYGEDGTELPDTLHTYEIGSLTKTFTAALICRGIQDGEILLDAGIDTYLTLPEKKQYPTVRELLTHTSGYKSYYLESPMICNFFNDRNDFYGVGDSMVLDRLGRESVLNGEYGFHYSNFGYAVLGQILEKVYETDYTTLLNSYVKDELGLENTYISDGNGDLGNMWAWRPGDAYISAGAMVSNVEDMLRYVNFQLCGAICDGDCYTMLEEINATPEQYEKLGLRMDAIAYAWLLDQKSGTIWHNGGTDDYNCYVGFDVENQVAVVVLSNLAPDYRIPATIIGPKLMSELKAG